MVGESLLRCHSNAAFTSRHLPPAGVLDPSCNQNLSANHVGFNGSVLTVSRGPDFSGKKDSSSVPPLLMKFQRGKGFLSRFVVFQNRSPRDQTFLFIPETPSEGQ